MGSEENLGAFMELRYWSCDTDGCRGVVERGAPLGPGLQAL